MRLLSYLSKQVKPTVYDKPQLEGAIKKSSQQALLSYLKKAGIYHKLNLLHLSLFGERTFEEQEKFEAEILSSFEQVLIKDGLLGTDNECLRLTCLMELEFQEYLSTSIRTLINDWLQSPTISTAHNLHLRRPVDVTIAEGLTDFLPKLLPDLERRRDELAEGLKVKDRENEEDKVEDTLSALSYSFKQKEFDLISLIKRPRELLTLLKSSKVRELTQALTYLRQLVESKYGDDTYFSDESQFCWRNDDWLALSTLLFMDMINHVPLNVSKENLYQVRQARLKRVDLELRLALNNPSLGLFRLVKSKSLPLLECWFLESIRGRPIQVEKDDLKALENYYHLTSLMDPDVPETMITGASREANWEDVRLSTLPLDETLWMLNQLLEQGLSLISSKIISSRLDFCHSDKRPYLQPKRLIQAHSLLPISNKAREAREIVLRQPWEAYYQPQERELLNCNSKVETLLLKHQVMIEHLKGLLTYLDSLTKNEIKSPHLDATGAELLSLALLRDFRKGHNELVLSSPEKFWRTRVNQVISDWTLGKNVRSMANKLILGILLTSCSQSILTIPFVWTFVVFATHLVAGSMLGLILLGIVKVDTQRLKIELLNLRMVRINSFTNLKLSGQTDVRSELRRRLRLFCMSCVPFCALLNSLRDLRESLLDGWAESVAQWSLKVGPRSRNLDFQARFMPNPRLRANRHDIVINDTNRFFPMNDLQNPSPIKNLWEKISLVQESTLTETELIKSGLIFDVAHSLSFLWQEAWWLLPIGFILPFLASANSYAKLHSLKVDGLISQGKLDLLRSSILLRQDLRRLTWANWFFITCSLALCVAPCTCLLSLSLLNLGLDPYQLYLITLTLLQGTLSA